MKSNPIINLNNLVDICGGDEKFMAEMIDLYLAQSEPQVNDLDSAFAEKDHEKIKKIAHKFKSSAQLFEITDLIELLLKIESTGLIGSKEKENLSILKKVRDISEIACIQLKKIRKNYD